MICLSKLAWGSLIHWLSPWSMPWWWDPSEMTAHHTLWCKAWIHKLQWKRKQCVCDFDPVRESVRRHWHSYCSLIQISYKSYTDRIHHFCMVPIMQSKCFPKLDKTMLPASTHWKWVSKQQIFRMPLLCSLEWLNGKEKQLIPFSQYSSLIQIYS